MTREWQVRSHSHAGPHFRRFVAPDGTILRQYEQRAVGIPGQKGEKKR